MAKAPASKSSPLKPFYIVIGVIAVVGVGLLAYQVFGKAQPAMQPVPVDVDPAELQRTPGIALGDEDAPVVIYEFADFQCPACAQYSSMYLPLVKERLIDEGLVRYVYYDFPLGQHQNAFIAARAGRCANEQGRFWDYHDYLYARQRTWAAMGNPTEFFVDLAEETGLDAGEFENCLRSDRYAEEVSRSAALGESLGVSGTPTLFVNGKRLPQVPSPFSRFEEMVRQEAGLTQPAQGADTTAAAAPAA